MLVSFLVDNLNRNFGCTKTKEFFDMRRFFFVFTGFLVFFGALRFVTVCVGIRRRRREMFKFFFPF